MLERKTARKTPDLNNHRYFAVELEKHGALYFKLPFPTKLAVIFDLLSKKDMGKFTKENVEKNLEYIEDAHDLMLINVCAIGLCWYGLNVDLESQLINKDYTAYGEALLDELYDTYTPSEITEITKVVMVSVVKSTMSQKKVDEQVDFS